MLSENLLYWQRNSEMFEPNGGLRDTTPIKNISSALLWSKNTPKLIKYVFKMM